jgi:hypothetical protein
MNKHWMPVCLDIFFGVLIDAILSRPFVFVHVMVSLLFSGTNSIELIGAFVSAPGFKA